MLAVDQVTPVYSETRYSLIKYVPQKAATAAELGVDLNAPCAELYAHATALHHAVSSGSLDAVKVLVEAGAALDRKDTVYGGTPLGWAEYGKRAEMTEYLRARGAS